MTVMAHMLSGAFIGISVAKVSPSETSLVVAAIISAGVLDIDHVFLILKKRAYFKTNGFKNTLHNARSFIHELFGFLLIGVVMLGISFFDYRLALILGVPAMIHLAEDVLMGISIPFSPIDRTKMQLLSQKRSRKVLVDIVTILIFGVLWVRYLLGVN